MNHISDYRNNTKFGENVINRHDILDISFKISNIPLGLANALRRTLLSGVPVVAFDDTWVDDDFKRSIVISKNTSGIHNEFLSPRLSLIPICMYKNPNIFKINTKYIRF